MAIQTLTYDQFEQSFQLGSYAFQFDDNETNRKRAQAAWKEGETYGHMEEDQLLAKLTLLDLDVDIHGAIMPMGGIAGVATYPEQRRKGLVRQLLVHALSEMNKRGQLLSYLHPFSVGFYRKFGWEILCEEVSFEMERGQLPQPSLLSSGEIMRVDITDTRLHRVYNQARQNGMLVRDAKWWKGLERKYEGKKVALYVDDERVPRAYLIYEVKKEEFQMEELCYAHREALSAMLSFIGQHDSMIEKATGTYTAGEALHYYLADPQIELEIAPYFMGRIVNVVRFLEAYPFQGGDAALTLRIHDDYAPWNNGIFHLKRENGQTTVEQGEDERGIDVSIQALSALLLGYQNVSFLETADELKGNEAELATLSSIVPMEKPRFPDFF
ncbi:GNAT family N-acetyltransferase [Shouchella shacheensis]|uniref:GNAT family N-acetyltransferase n=1 Tax=Shouchella shacheensis TaxID=1649580 RepID=UPI0007401A71|nr:GNAT family N-acetyltransferase [Shouchella shacheensis]